MSKESLNDYDLIGFGSGIYFGKFHERLLDMAGKGPDSTNLQNARKFAESLAH
ncbi:MAG: hypothetical protein HPY55_05660 [Firmicutes bacterium]|nr:hypothetical protein [Bacillota bacterium]